MDVLFLQELNFDLQKCWIWTRPIGSSAPLIANRSTASGIGTPGKTTACKLEVSLWSPNTLACEVSQWFTRHQRGSKTYHDDLQDTSMDVRGINITYNTPVYKGRRRHERTDGTMTGNLAWWTDWGPGLMDWLGTLPDGLTGNLAWWTDWGPGLMDWLRTWPDGLTENLAWWTD